MEPKFRTIKKTNAILINQLFSVPFLEQLLILIGYQEQGQILGLPDEKIGNIYALMNSFKGWFQLITLKKNSQLKEYEKLKNLLISDAYIDKHTKKQSCLYCKQEDILLFVCSCNKAQYCSSQCKENHKLTHSKRCQAWFQEEKEVSLQLIETENSKFGMCGLTNLGNTCYMNSGLQCLINCFALSKELISFQYNSAFQQEDFNQKLKASHQFNYGEQMISMNFEIQSLLEALIIMHRHMFLGVQSVFTPLSFKKILGIHHPIFNGYNQNDSQEFIGRVLQSIKEECEILSDILKKTNNITQQEQQQQGEYKENLKLQSIFDGEFQSYIECSQCQSSSIQNEHFTSVSLPIPEQNNIEHVIQLHDCLNLFQETEILQNENAYYCNKCEEKVVGYKSIRIKKFPQILIFHLKRFDKTLVESTLETLRKEDQQKEISIQSKEVQQQNQEQAQQEEDNENKNIDEQEEEQEKQEEQTKEKLKNERKQLELKITKKESLVQFPLQSLWVQGENENQHCEYDLVGVSNHYGRFSGGHYTAFCKNQTSKLWFEFNDSNVLQIDNLDIIVSQAAYMLFYEKKNNN